MPNIMRYPHDVASHAALARAQESEARAENKLAKVKMKAEEMTGGVIRTAEVAGAAFAMGMMNGRSAQLHGKPPEIVGVPVDLALGVALNVVGHAKLVGKSSHHIHALGDGCLASYFVGLGFGTGRQVGLESAAAQPPTPPPAP